ncbi:MAG: glycoside hydrolase family 28 protein [Prevotella sp.]|jgi:polygalacturonase|nr:glycoside hydrolase family 28 protein [Prevotella sp.]
MKRSNINSVLLLLLFTAGLFAQKTPYAYLYSDLPFKMPVLTVPVFPANKVSVTDFGGAGDGITLNTGAFAEAVAALEKKGGGTLLVPSGVWLTGPIVLKSNINLHLQDKAIILFSPDKSLYPIVETVFEGLNTRRCQSPISARNVTNVAITGNGAIDGNGQVWRPLKKQKVSESFWRSATSFSGVFKRADYWMPSASYLRADTISDMNVPEKDYVKTDADWESIRDFLRPVMISFIECKNVYLSGVIFQNSPAWNIHPLMCENVIIDGIQARNPAYAQNGDGLDLESCKNSIIVNSTFDVGDDGICIKSGKGDDGRKRARPCENLIVDNCTVFRGHGGFVVGSEMSGGVKNIKVSNCQFLGTDVGLRFKSSRGRGGVVENIYVSNISMFDIVTEPLLFDLYYDGKSAVEVLADGNITSNVPSFPQANETTPAFLNIYIKDVTCSSARRAMFFNGLPEMNISNVNIENVNIHSTIGAELSESDRITLKNVGIYPKSGAALTLKNVKNAEIDRFHTNPAIPVFFDVSGKNSKAIKINTPCSPDKIKLDSSVDNENIRLVQR